MKTSAFFELDNNLIFTCVPICFFIQMPTWDRSSWTSSGPYPPHPPKKKLHKGLIMWHDNMSDFLLKIQTESLPSSSALTYLRMKTNNDSVMILKDDSNAYDKLASYLCVSKWCYMTDAKSVGNSSNKSPFQLFCVCSVILSVSSAFQRPVLGMIMRKMTMNYKWWLYILFVFFF